MSSHRSYRDDDSRFAAILRRDELADGAFFFGVLTTGVYCYPSCSSRPALRQNVLFYQSAALAEQAGFRPCKRCQPERPPRAKRELDLIVACCEKIKAEPELSKLDELAKWARLSPYHFHRLFRRITGITPMVYIQARRQLRLQESLTRGANITASIYEAGFQSSARFYELATDMLGMKPSVYRAGAPAEIIYYELAPCLYGMMLAARTVHGACSILLGADEKLLINNLRIQFPRACLHRDIDVKSAITESIETASLLIPTGLPQDIEVGIFQIHVNRLLRHSRRDKQPVARDYSAAVS